MHGMRCVLWSVGVGLLAGTALAAEKPPEPKPRADGIKLVTQPVREPLAPEERGKPYKVPATNWQRDPVLWGWSCELPNGTGLAFGGVQQVSDDGRPHTSVLEGGQWKDIAEDLRKKNPLQKHCATAVALRDACKNTLARARHIYFEGMTADEEAKRLGADVEPDIAKLAKDLAAFAASLKNASGLEAYEAGQCQVALKYLEAAAGTLKPFGARASVEQLTDMRKSQVELERARDLLDAEPPPRMLSMVTWEPKNKVFVIFGGEHGEYVSNDLWIFDPAKRKWFHRHQAAAPEPRADHHLDALGDGRLVMFGGYTHEKGYTHVGPARWIYDVEKNAWAPEGHQEAGCASDSRKGGYAPPSAPEHFMKGARPDAAAQAAVLKGLPANTWVRLKTPTPLGGRDWGTWVFDADRDMMYVWSGGHASYAGNDVARYHLATDRWEITHPPEVPIGCAGTNEQYPSGFSFNQRPWVKKHVWNSQSYDPVLKQMIMGGANDAKIDPYCYFYDPDKADWVGRLRLPDGMPNDAYGMQIRYTKHGMLAWNGGWLFDSKAKAWNKMAIKGNMPGGGVDSSGLAYDSKRDRMLFFTLGGYAKPYDGQIHALDMNTLQVAPLNPAGMNPSGRWDLFLREVTHIPDSDLFLWSYRLNINGKAAPDLFPAYDAAKNRWVTVKLAMPADAKPFDRSAVCISLHWDAKRGLLWCGDASWDGGVYVLRFDPKSVEIKPLTEYAIPAAEAKK